MSLLFPACQLLYLVIEDIETNGKSIKTGPGRPLVAGKSKRSPLYRDFGRVYQFQRLLASFLAIQPHS